jgi:hypothetical protein
MALRREQREWLESKHCKKVRPITDISSTALEIKRNSGSNVACILIARKQLSKHIPAEENIRNNRKSTARQWISKHSSITGEDVFSAWSMQSSYK